MSMIDLTRMIQDTAAATNLRASGYVYPLIEGTHVFSLTLAVGTILWVDLRLLGWVMRGESIKKMYASLRPWILTGFSLMVITGAILFFARASDVWGSGYFRVKLVLLVLCAINISVYHLLTSKGIDHWDTSEYPPRSARIAGGVSLLLWFSVILVGRFMAYNL